MPNKDILEKQLTSFNDVAADLINTLLFQSDTISPHELGEAMLHAFWPGQECFFESERDVLKLWKDSSGQKIACFGLENQSSADPLMPLRILCYDGGTCQQQMARQRAGKHKSSKRTGKAEDDAIVPVFTLVLYTGIDRPWNTARTLKESLTFRRPGLESMMPDGRWLIFDIGELDDEVIAGMKSDYKYAAMYVKAARHHQPFVLDDKIYPDHPFALWSLLAELSGSGMSEKELRKAFMNEERTVNTMINLLSQEEKQNIWNKAWKEASEVTREKTWKEASEVTREKTWKEASNKYSRLISWLAENNRLDEVQKTVSSPEEFERLYKEMEGSHLEK